jgi:hypothetical protein
MNEISCKTLKSGKLRVTLDIDPGEKLITIREDSFYKLGYPFEEVVQSHIIQDSYQVTWCPLGQEWVS